MLEKIGWFATSGNRTRATSLEGKNDTTSPWLLVSNHGPLAGANSPWLLVSNQGPLAGANSPWLLVCRILYPTLSPKTFLQGLERTLFISSFVMFLYNFMGSYAVSGLFKFHQNIPHEEFVARCLLNYVHGNSRIPPRHGRTHSQKYEILLQDVVMFCGTRESNQIPRKVHLKSQSMIQSSGHIDCSGAVMADVR